MPTSSFLPMLTASHPEDHSADSIHCDSPRSSHTTYHSAPPSATFTTGFTLLGQHHFDFQKTSLPLQAVTGQYKILRVGRPCLCFLELSPARGPTSAPRVADGWTRGAAGKSNYSENDLSQHHKSHAVTWHLCSSRSEDGACNTPGGI
jgi:hypothetical protein